MNTNEVAGPPGRRSGWAHDVHPNDHVNASQSSNDVFPTAIHLAAAEAVVVDLIPAARAPRGGARAKAAEFARVVKSGRTHLMDATPVTLGQEFGGYAAQLAEASSGCRTTLPRVGPAAARRHRRRHRAERPARPSPVGSSPAWPPAPACPSSRRPTTSPPRPPVTRSSSCRASCGRWPWPCTRSPTTCAGWRSGPRTGLAEIRLPDLQPGSSIMPGKVNPVMPEAVTQVVGPGHRQRRRRRLRRQPGPLRAEHLHAGDGPQPAGVDPAAGVGEPAAARPLRRRHRGRRRALPDLRRGLAVDRHLAGPAHRLRARRPRSSRSRPAPAARCASWCSRPACSTRPPSTRPST